MFPTKKQGVLLICILCILTCIGDLLVLYLLGRKFPGYDQALNTISSLGASVSPVSNLISGWWVIIGIVFILFAFAFGIEYKEKGKSAIIAAWLIALYGLGEGMGSGLFKADHIGDSLTTSAIIHDALGGIGTLAILILPLVMQRVFPKEEYRVFNIYSGVIFYVGIFSSFLFLLRYTGDNVISHYTGLWQRITLIISYAYFLVIAFRMAKNESISRYK